MKHWILPVAALFAVSAQAAVTPPDEVVKATTGLLSKTIKERHAEFKAKPDVFFAVVESIIVPKFDLRYIAQLILARNWKETSEEQRTQFQTAFKNMLIRSYANTLLDFNDKVQAEWQPLRMNPDDTDVTVKSNLVRQSGPPVPIGFAMRLKGGEWKVYDITVESISLVSSFRSQAASEIKKIGVDGLIEKLNKGDGFGVARKKDKDS